MRKLVIILTVLLAVSFISLLLMYWQYIDTKRAVLSYNREVSDLDKIISQLREKNNESLKQVEENHQNIKELKMAQNQISVLENTIESLNSQISVLEGTIKSLNNQVSSSDSRFKKLKIDYDSLLSEKQSLEVQFFGLASKDRNLQDSLNELIHNFRRINGELNMLKYVNETLREQLDEYMEERDNLKAVEKDR